MFIKTAGLQPHTLDMQFILGGTWREDTSAQDKFKFAYHGRVVLVKIKSIGYEE